MNTLDLLILIVLAAGLVLGFSSGLIKQVLSFIGLIVAFVLSLHLMKTVGDLVTASLGISTDIAPLVGFVLVFLAVEVGVFALVRLLETLVGVLKLTTVNRLLGGAVGAFKAAIVLSVAFLVLGKLHVPSDGAKKASSFYAPVATVLPTAWTYVSRSFPQVERLSEQFGEGVKRQLPQADQPEQVAR